MYLRTSAPSEKLDQSAHLRSLIRVFAVRLCFLPIHRTSSKESDQTGRMFITGIWITNLHNPFIIGSSAGYSFELIFPRGYSLELLTKELSACQASLLLSSPIVNGRWIDKRLYTVNPRYNDSLCSQRCCH